MIRENNMVYNEINTYTETFISSRTEVITEANLIKVIRNNQQEAEKIIQNEDKFEKLIQGVERAISDFPVIGKYLSDIICMVSLVRNYIKKEYTDVPI